MRTALVTGSARGIGAAIARHLAELHGGDVSANSDGPDKGSTFTVRLPLLTGPDAATREGTNPGLPAHSLRDAKHVAIDGGTIDGAIRNHAQSRLVKPRLDNLTEKIP